MMQPAFTLVRYAVFAAVVLAALLAFGAMAVQQRTINPFSRLARLIRNLSDPAIKPIERRVLRSGGNPQTAPWWLIGTAVVGGILVISGAQWAMAAAAEVSSASARGGKSLVVMALDGVLWVLSIALLIRVIGSWLGMGAYHKFMRPFYAMTEWFLGPLRRLLPAFGPMDFSPLVAWIVIQYVLRPVVHSL